eukprot:TRINITY_DN58086_c0_g1_i1.p1 TRINITY_DN58086_c0_g1~~TRINITY_DN58086_c0_g1_i1.p1  ORF type:complete len:241 (-),score=53.02 TRINITY_DN58086_c0_g1_i1:38-736(-)
MSALQAGKPARGVIVKAVYLVGKTQIAVSAGSVVDFAGDALVNAANSGGLGGAGVDGAVNSRGGRALQEARQALPVNEEGDRIPVGEARITIGGNLPAKWAIHAVGPMYPHSKSEDFSECDALLSSAYASSLKLAEEKQLSSVGFSLLSAGIFRGACPLSTVLEIACQAVKDSVYEGLEEVHLVAFTPEEQMTLLKAAETVLSSSGRERKEGEPAPPPSPTSKAKTWPCILM